MKNPLTAIIDWLRPGDVIDAYFVQSSLYDHHADRAGSDFMLEHSDRDALGGEVLRGRGKRKREVPIGKQVR